MTLVSWIALTLAAQAADDVAARLRNTRVSHLVVEDETLETVLERLAATANLEIRLVPEVREGHGSESVSLGRLHGLTVRSVLRLILRERGLTAVPEDGVVWVVPIEHTYAHPVTRVYDVRDLTLCLTDFAPPELTLGAPGDYATPMLLVSYPPAEEESALELETLADVVRRHTGRDPENPAGESLWDKVPGADARPIGGLLIITQIEPVQADIRRLLDRLRLSR